MFKSRPFAAGFTFKVQIHVTTWGVTNHVSKFKVGRYLNRTRVMADRVKHVTRPERLQPGGLSTHGFLPNWDKGYHR